MVMRIPRVPLKGIIIVMRITNLLLKGSIIIRIPRVWGFGVWVLRLC